MREGEERSPALTKKPTSQSAFRLSVHDFVHREMAIQRVSRFSRSYASNKLRRMSRRVSFDSPRLHHFKAHLINSLQPFWVFSRSRYVPLVFWYWRRGKWNNLHFDWNFYPSRRTQPSKVLV